MTEPEKIEPASSDEGEDVRKSFRQRFNSPEWEARAAVLAGALGLAAVIITTLKR